MRWLKSSRNLVVVLASNVLSSIPSLRLILWSVGYVIRKSGKKLNRHNAVPNNLTHNQQIGNVRMTNTSRVSPKMSFEGD